MVTTVTTTTTAILNGATAGSLALLITCGLIALLVKRELIAGLSQAWAQRLRSGLNVAIVPLTIVFVVSVAMRIALLLG